MALTLVDTSAWVEYLRVSESPADRALTSLIANDDEVAVTEPVMMELLAGARDPGARRNLKRLLVRFELLTFESTTDFAEAASIYRSCRAVGHTPRNYVDCLIAAVALRNDAQVLASDVDFERISDATGMKLRAA